MQISTFKLSDFGFESGFFILLKLHFSDLKVSTQKFVEYMQHFLQLSSSSLY